MKGNFKILVLWIFSLIMLSAFSYAKISDGAESSLGERAEVIALGVADSLSINGESYNRLLGLDFEELLDDEVNVRFEERSRKYMMNTDVKYIYLASVVSDEEARYTVTKSEASYHGIDRETKLNKVYVLDAVESVNTRLKDLGGDWYVDRDRYEVVNGVFEDMYKRRISGYRKTNSSWGEYITGYAPAYSTEGKYMGLVGVDIYMDSYYNWVHRYGIALGIFILFNMVLGVLVIYFMEKSIRESLKLENMIETYSKDPLTSVLSRQSFLDNLADAWDNSINQEEGLSLMIFDIDYFKRYNDTYGHLEGDSVIKSVCNEVSDFVSKKEGFMGRFGGDEFLVAFNGLDYQKTREISKEILERVRGLEYKHENSEVSEHVTISLGGIYIKPKRDMVLEEIMKIADDELYRAKYNGKNCDSILYYECNSEDSNQGDILKS